MAGSEALHNNLDFVYDPVCLIPEGMFYDRNNVENYFDTFSGPAYNPETGGVFDTKDIQPQPEVRMQLRQRILERQEYFLGQHMPLHWEVIQHYPFDISDETHMSDYVNSLAMWINNVIMIPQNSRNLSKGLNLLRLNCQYSEKNTILFRSVNGFYTLIGALSKHFYFNRLWRTTNDMDFLSLDLDEDTVGVCREVIKLVEITGFNVGDAAFITDSPSHAECFGGIMNICFFRSGHGKDMRRVLRIVYTISNIQGLQLLDFFFPPIRVLSRSFFVTSEEFGLCAEISYAYCQDQCRLVPLAALCDSLGILVSRFTNSEQISEVLRPFAHEQYTDRSAALEKVLKALCRICAKYGAEAVHFLISPGLVRVVSYASRILMHSLLHPELGTATFGGRHLLFALTLLKYIYQSPAGDTASPEKIKILFDFAMSAVPTRFLFNGRRMLKDLADQVVDNMLLRQPTEYVLRHWNEIRPGLFGVLNGELN